MKADDLASSSFSSMGTDVAVLAPPSQLTAAVGIVRPLFAAWDERFSRFRPGSELSRLNRSAGTSFSASEPMLEVVSAAIAAARATGGLFDPSVAPRLVALGYDRDFAELASHRPEARLAGWHAGGWREIEIDRAGGWIRLPAGTTIDLGGIAKGMAVDAALALLQQRAITPACVNAGGDLGVIGELEQGWPIGLDEAGERTVVLHAGGLATSSVLRRRWHVGPHERHHLIDPRTGMPATGSVVSASVSATSCREAEVAAKAALLLGAERGASFLGRHRLAGVLALRSGAVLDIGEWRVAA